ncbi:MAG: hypothetical protein V4547_16455 [Bacteroidota bacterium]
MTFEFKNPTEVNALRLKNIVGTDDLRPAMAGVFIDFVNSCLVGTDAHIIFTYPIDIVVKETEDRGRIVPISYFDTRRYMQAIPPPSKRLFIDNVQAELEYKLSDEFAEVYWLGELVYRCRYIDEKYPAYEGIMLVEAACQPVDKIGINTRLMKRLCDAFPPTITGTAKMILFSPNRGIVFKSEERYGNENHPIIGILMPVMLND